MFRAPAEPDFEEPARTESVAATPAVKEPPRRVLVDLVAEAAIAEQVADAMPEPRRRGRPAKPKIEGPAKIPGKRGRKPKAPVVFEFPEFELPMPDEPVVVPTAIVLDLAASRRRRVARSTDNLPRSERWKRRLPKVCW